MVNRRRRVEDDRAAEGAVRAVASAKNQQGRRHGGMTFIVLVGIVLIGITLAGVGCSGSDPVVPDESALATPSATGDDGTAATANGGTAEATPSVVSAPTLATEAHASVTDLAAGEQVTDVQGNLIAIYGLAQWPASFNELTDDAQSLFPFFGDVSAASDPNAELVVLDIGMCSAGIDASGSGTAEFFLHGSPDDVLSTDQLLDRGVLARHPVVQPGFVFPAAAECTRGFVPVLWSGTEAPTTARYVVATRESADADIERHVYQWDIDNQIVEVDVDVDEDQPAFDQFLPGQTVTFNTGPLADTTVVVDGWAERVGAASVIEGTRVVSVSLTLCPASSLLPEFGLAVDGWNVVASLPGDVLGAAASAAPSENCFDGWLDFAVPFGGVPTAFFASDAQSSTIGYAEWPLDTAALPAPQ